MTILQAGPRPRPAFIVFIPFLALLLAFASSGRDARAQSPGDAAPTIQVEIAPTDPAATSLPADLPDAPAPALSDPASAPSGEFSSGDEATAGPLAFGVAPSLPGHVPLDQCPDDTTHARECRFHWHQLLITSAVFNAFQNAGNLYTGYWYRYETTTGPWFQRWFNSDLDWKWSRWSDGNPFLDQYVGHPMMGSITNYMWIQNDPKGMTVDLSNSREYWQSRERALLWSTFYSFEWKFGPFGEAGVGHNGDHIQKAKSGPTNGTGDVELVTTPLGGLLWTMAEDTLDKYVTRRIDQTPHSPFALLALSFLTPSRATANIFRFRPPWYRDGRQVKAKSFFSEPPGPDDEVVSSQPPSPSGKPATFTAPEAGFVRATSRPDILPLWPHYGGVHEFGAWWGLSLISGHVWGYAKDVKYMPVDITYSYLLYPGAKWNFRYAPELTALAMLDEINPNPGKIVPYDQNLRRRTYGSGISPVGFRASFYPESRVQPFLSTDGGFIYFGDRVLSPQGSQFMYTIDFGGGLMIYRKQRQALSIGYRYQHLSNANISLHNPGTDCNTFYVAVSRFRSKGYR